MENSGAEALNANEPREAYGVRRIPALWILLLLGFNFK